ncbi:predicted protein [Naegleria gruberi]|uniref:Predicted protein n=1 Tax=Naegleria gruberi TaxID=5762 RepID=D2W0U3_NAEGR|nr:uncharacterized protein NAEGRDRAFT_74982 [Naegleria gruberi]EFC37348.1 predicted protein [Naegleria gruberi]|eukprot:XP_002670092.1 predicted protein [Naegleria gruberi strain NEG-M]
MSDMVNINKLILVTERITKLTTGCHTILENLAHEFSNDKTVLRFYAGFVEDVLFNAEFAQEMYTDASVLEEEDSKRVEMVITKSNRRIVPLSESVDNGSLSYEKSFNEKLEKAKDAFQENRKRSLEILSVNMNDDKESDLGTDAFENPLVKKESMFKLALNTPTVDLAQKILFYCLIGLMFSLLIAGFVMSVQFSISALQEVPRVKTTCKTLISPISTISDLRMKQLLITAFNDSRINPPTSTLKQQKINTIQDFEKLFTERILSHNKALDDLSHLANYGELSDEMLTDYKQNRFILKLPEIPHGSPLERYDGYFETNTSVTEISQAIRRYADTFLYTNLTAIETTTDYSFMFFWYNKYILQDSLEGFCYEFIQRSQEQISKIQFSFMIFLIVSSATISVISTLVISFLVYKTYFIDGSIKLFSKTLAKDAIGKVYHRLGKIVNERASTHVSKHSLFRPRNLIVLFGLALTLILIASNGLFFVQVILNCTDGTDVMDDVKYVF